MGLRAPQAGPRPMADPWLRLVVALGAFFLALAPLLFWGGAAETFELPKALLLRLYALSVLAVAATAAARRRRLPRLDPVAWAVLGFVGSAVASTIASVQPFVSLLGAHESFGGLTTLAALAVAFFGFRWAARAPKSAESLLVAPLAAAAAATAYALIQAAGLDPILWADTSTFADALRPFGTLAHPSHLGTYLAMCLPLAAFFAWRALEAGRLWSGAALVLIAAAMLVAIGLSLARGAWLAVAACALIAVGTVARRHPRRALAPSAAAVAAGIAAAGLFLLLPGGSERWAVVTERAARFWESPRLLIWQAALRVFEDHPILGSGIDTFQLAFLRHRPIELWWLEGNRTPIKAHSVPLHVLATQGIVGALALVGLVAALVVRARRAWRDSAGGERPLLAAVLLGLVAFALTAAVGFTVVATSTLFAAFAGVVSGWKSAPEGECAVEGRRVAMIAGGAAFLALFVAHAAGGPWIAVLASTGAMASVFAAALWASGRASSGLVSEPDETPGAFRGSWTAPTAIGLAWVLLVGVTVVRPLAATHACRQGMDLMARKPVALAQLQRSIALDPWDPYCATRLGLAAEKAAQAGVLPDERAAAIAIAEAAFERALELVPANPWYHANLGRLRSEVVPEERIRPAESMSEHEAAVALDPNNPDLAYQAAKTALRLGDRELARRWSERALALVDYAPARAELGYLALAEGRLEEAVSELRRAVKGKWGAAEPERLAALVNLSSALLKLGRAKEAEAPAREAVERAPESAEARYNLAMALGLSGKIPAALKELERLREQHPGFQPAAAALTRFRGE